MDLYRVMNAADNAVEHALEALDNEAKLLDTHEEWGLVRVTFFATMAAKYLALRPDQRLPASIFHELLLIEKKRCP